MHPAARCRRTLLDEGEGLAVLAPKALVPALTRFGGKRRLRRRVGAGVAMSRTERRLRRGEFELTGANVRLAAAHVLARWGSRVGRVLGRGREPAQTPAVPRARESRGRASWYRGPNCNFLPSKQQLAADDAIARYVLEGWTPERPFIDRDMYITTFGSCFAEHVTTYLYRNGYKVFGRDLKQDTYIIRCGEGLVNTFAIRQQFEWALGEREFAATLWHDRDGKVLDYDADVRRVTRDIMLGTDVFVITLGLSEIWYDKESGEAFWRAVPADHFDPGRHGFKVSTTEENRQNLAAIHGLIRRHRPEAAIILTLSPVPLSATFRPVSCITANAVSKAVLRVAVDEFMREQKEDARLFYFPSYEIVKEVIGDAYADDNRHVRPEVIARVMGAFSRAFLVG